MRLPPLPPVISTHPEPLQKYILLSVVLNTCVPLIVELQAPKADTLPILVALGNRVVVDWAKVLQPIRSKKMKGFFMAKNCV